MTFPLETHWVAGLALNRLLYGLGAGTLLASGVGVALRFSPKGDSQSRFAIWFSTLLAVAALPFLGAIWTPQLHAPASGKAILLIPAGWVTAALLGWALVAVAGVLRVLAGLWHIRRLRKNSVEIDPAWLDQDVRSIIQEFKKSRRVSILRSSSLEVPTALGFFHPAVVIPQWLLDGAAPGDLKHVFLHELSHLRRRDDWTNLIQKLLKAVLFFHPSVWWIERKLALDREMACDQAVLAHTGSARVYAQCLARMAERGLARRRLALVQAAVDRARQLSVRVAQILSEDRPRNARLWKPAIPMVAAGASLCAVIASQAPQLVTLEAPQTKTIAASASIPSLRQVAANPLPVATFAGRLPDVPAMKRIPLAAFQPASYSLTGRARAKPKPVAHRQMKISTPARLAAIRTGLNQSEADDRDGVLVVFVSTTEVQSSASELLQVQTLEFRWVTPERHATRPLPRKT